MARNMWVTTARTESSQRTNQTSWKRLRLRVLKRDGYECQIRGPRCLDEATMVDHILPVSYGGDDSEDNSQAVCAPCHHTKTAQERAALRPRPSRRRTAPMHPADALGGQRIWPSDGGHPGRAHKPPEGHHPPPKGGGRMVTIDVRSEGSLPTVDHPQTADGQPANHPTS
jgi:5-methylcytosine-specific restriction enzyme A